MKITATIFIPDALIEKVCRGIMANFPESNVGCIIKCQSWKYDDMKFEFLDEEENTTHIITLDKCMKAFPLLFTDKWGKGRTQPPLSDKDEDWDNWLCQSDAGDFGAFVELIVFGEVC